MTVQLATNLIQFKVVLMWVHKCASHMHALRMNECKTALIMG